jgi:hypothetical protein
MNKQIKIVKSKEEFISTPYDDLTNAICWQRTLHGNFSEIINKLELHGNLTEVDPEDLLALDLSEEGAMAREILLSDFKLLSDFGADPSLNVIKYYEEDDEYVFFPTDVYSFHVDRSPVAIDTILCTYHGDASELIPNHQAIQKIQIPNIRESLKKKYGGPEEGFENFLIEHFFDLHYEALPNASIVNLGIGNLWRLAVDSPEESGAYRLLMIC